MMKKQKQKRKMNLSSKIALGVFVAFCVFTIYSMQADITEMTKTQKSLDAQIAVQKEKNAELKENLAEPYDNNFIMKTAREKLGYSLPGEIIFYNDLTE